MKKVLVFTNGPSSIMMGLNLPLICKTIKEKKHTEIKIIVCNGFNDVENELSSANFLICEGEIFRQNLTDICYLKNKLQLGVLETERKSKLITFLDIPILEIKNSKINEEITSFIEKYL